MREMRGEMREMRGEMEGEMKEETVWEDVIICIL